MQNYLKNFSKANDPFTKSLKLNCGKFLYLIIIKYTPPTSRMYVLALNHCCADTLSQQHVITVHDPDVFLEKTFCKWLSC